MKNLATVLCLVVAVLLGASLPSLAEPPGLEKKADTPPDFTHGEKTGWKDNYPPVWDHKSEKEKEKWKKDIQKGREAVSKTLEGKGLSKEEIAQIARQISRGYFSILRVEKYPLSDRLATS
ncbi:MAG: hypothetical protein UZ01_00751 [Candidatus Brocadia sinica]|nr:MAG: hypothetical protein UZ01_00751 [Candidatus Brocadia sinica]MCK6467511.1 hypothetical protein [Candidatus Brocadia sinica]